MSTLPPVFRRLLSTFEQQSAILELAAEKAAPRRFDGSSITGFGGLDADAPDERLALERDMYDDMQRRYR